MKRFSKILGISLLATTLGFMACSKEGDNKNECYTCTDCQGQYGHLLNGEKCSDGFDNKEDWREHKKNMEEENGCKCE